MWFLILLTLFNAGAHQLDVINAMRFDFGRISLGVMELSAMVLFVYALIFGSSISSRYPNHRTHPAFAVTLGLLVAGFIVGSIGSFIEHVPLELYLRQARELGTWPVFMFVGYRLLGSPRSAIRFVYVLIIAGTLTATMLLTNFGSKSEGIEWHDNFNVVRTSWYIGAYAGMAAMTLGHSLATKSKLLPMIIAAPLACYCLAGQCAPLHRGDWLAMILCTGGLVSLVPPGKRVATALRGLVVVGVLALGLVVAITIVSSTTNRNFGEYVQNRLVSLLPSERQTTHDTKAWDTRVGSIQQELDIWATNPLIGRGIEIQAGMVVRGTLSNTMAYHHNGWASILAQMGLVGFAGYMMIVGGLFWIGRKVALRSPDRRLRLVGVVAFLGAIYMIAGVAAGPIWATRYAILFGTLCGMAYRCLDMMPIGATDQAFIDQASMDQAGLPDSMESEWVHASEGF